MKTRRPCRSWLIPALAISSLTLSAACKYPALDLDFGGFWGTPSTNYGTGREHCVNGQSCSAVGCKEMGVRRCNDDGTSAACECAHDCDEGELGCAGASRLAVCVDGKWSASRECPADLPVCRAGACGAAIKVCSSLRIVGPAAVSVPLGEPARTFEAWASLEPTPTSPAIVLGRGGASRGGWVLYCSAGRVDLGMYTETGYQLLGGPASCDDGRFHHFALSFGPSTKLFFDGTQIGESAAVPEQLGLPLFVGSWAPWSVTSVATIDELAVGGDLPYVTDFVPGDTLGVDTSRWFRMRFDEGEGTRTRNSNVVGIVNEAVVDETMWVKTCH